MTVLIVFLPNSTPGLDLLAASSIFDLIYVLVLKYLWFSLFNKFGDCLISFLIVFDVFSLIKELLLLCLFVLNNLSRFLLSNCLDWDTNYFLVIEVYCPLIFLDLCFKRHREFESSSLCFISLRLSVYVWISLSNS